MPEKQIIHPLRRRQLEKYGEIESKSEFKMRIGNENNDIILKYGDEKIINYIKNKVLSLTVNDIRANEFSLKSYYAVDVGLNTSLVANYFGMLVCNVLLPDYIYDWEEKAIEEEMDRIIHNARSKERMKMKQEGFFQINIGSEEAFMDEVEKLYGGIPPRQFNIGGIFGTNRFSYDDEMLIYTGIIPVRLVKGNTFERLSNSESVKTEQRSDYIPRATEVLKHEQVMDVLTGLFGKPRKKGEFFVDSGKYMGFFIQTAKVTDDSFLYGDDNKDKYLTLKIVNPHLSNGLDFVEMKDYFINMLELNNLIINKLGEALNYKNGRRYCTYSKPCVLSEVKAEETNEKLNEKFKHLLMKIKTPVFFDEIGGQKEAKKEMMDLVKAFKNSAILEAWASKPPTGIVLKGPPGTGKSKLAVALASAIDAEVYKIKLTDIMKTAYINAGSNMVSELFDFLRAKARENPKRKIVVVLEEMEALLGARGGQNGSQEDTKVVNTFLDEMNTCEEDENIMFMGTTNKIKSVDEAIIRSGRMTLQIEVGLPNKEDRKEIFEIHIKKAIKKGKRKILDSELDFNILAEKSDKFSGADIEHSVILRALYKKAMVEISGVPKEELSLTTNDLIREIELFKKSKGMKNTLGFQTNNN